MTARVTVAVLSLALLVTGCGSGAVNKAGGSKPPLVLTLADSDNNDQPSTDAVLYFAEQVDRISGGSLRIRVTFQAAGKDTPRVEQRTIGLVRGGRFDLGVVGSRAWDELGFTSFRALQAPFLITSTKLLNRVLESHLAADMIASLKQEDVVGLALVPDHLRRPVGFRRPFLSLGDFAQGRIRFLPSKTTAAILRTLGATPVEASNVKIGQEISDGRVNGEEMSFFNSPGNSISTGNIVFFGKALNFFVNADAFGRLSTNQRRYLRDAAARTTTYAAAHNPSELGFARCPDRRRVVLATAADVRAVEQAAQPVYAQLETDPVTKRYIDRIPAIKATLPPDPPIHVGGTCARVVPSARAVGRRLSPSLVNGTYRWVLTAADARAFGPPATDPGNTYPSIQGNVLKDGKWRAPGPDDNHGTYFIRGNRITFVWPGAATTNVYRFRRDVDGTLHLTPIPPMDPGDQFVTTFEPWRRIGPPTALDH